MSAARPAAEPSTWTRADELYGPDAPPASAIPPRRWTVEEATAHLKAHIAKVDAARAWAREVA